MRDEFQNIVRQNTHTYRLDRPVLCEIIIFVQVIAAPILRFLLFCVNAFEPIIPNNKYD